MNTTDNRQQIDRLIETVKQELAAYSENNTSVNVGCEDCGWIILALPGSAPDEELVNVWVSQADEQEYVISDLSDAQTWLTVLGVKITPMHQKLFEEIARTLGLDTNAAQIPEFRKTTKEDLAHWIWRVRDAVITAVTASLALENTQQKNKQDR